MEISFPYSIYPIDPNRINADAQLAKFPHTILAGSRLRCLLGRIKQRNLALRQFSPSNSITSKFDGSKGAKEELEAEQDSAGPRVTKVTKGLNHGNMEVQIKSIQK